MDYEKEKQESTQAFTGMTYENRKIACDHMIHDHILHLEQSKLKAQRAHKVLMKDFNDHIKNLKRSIKRSVK